MAQLWQREMVGSLADFETPAVVVHQAKVVQNIQEMAEFARAHGVRVRPHLKTHKTWEIAELQRAAGAVGLTCAKLGEAEVFLERGARDVLVAYPLVGPKIQRLFALQARYPEAVVQTMTDSLAQARLLSDAAVAHERRLKLWVKVDSGLKRCGITPGVAAAELVRQVVQLPGIELQGLLTHAGHAYGASSPEQVRAIGEYEAMCLLETVQVLSDEGRGAGETAETAGVSDVLDAASAVTWNSLAISVGSTPTVRVSGAVPGVTEIRPGNYVFYDATQVQLGVVPVDRVALRVFTRVVSRPAPDRLVIDAGAKTLALDRGAHGSTTLQGYGLIVGHDDAVIERLSEEHGVVRIPSDSPIQVGDLFEVIPNHACPVANLTDQLKVLQPDGTQTVWQVIARGQTV
ncbi:alanine racemase [Tumebacillus permanentifrigoris]|uniref:D-serine deaminase-like pyridoxal phosphate-dependent protein n=1 Tax=Tumebacillus permanentifrigoris TaxID=378543 RepID=A0A316D797_9BACL|nr:alanine racemase [Tumebacillus permanentifrigoris]PWK11336.1 D-serine deaminase-like pyridoxal phosphate-dependent protein [Tumebacillus permanentifrigoris]